MDIRYDVYEHGKLIEQNVTLEMAANTAQLDEADIEWSVEEYGIAETETHAVVEHGDTPLYRGSFR